MAFKPNTKEELKNAVNLYCDNKDEGIKKYGIIGEWDVSLITDMSELVYGKLQFNYDISNWNVSSVANMEYMFFYCTSFNKPLNNWDVSNVTNMRGMFGNCHTFNQLLNNWNTSNVTNMECIFNYCYKFNQSLNNWDVSNVTNMNIMFGGCYNYNQPLNNWDVSNVDYMYHMFFECNNFDQPLYKWNISHIFDIDYLIIDLVNGCANFDQSLISWRKIVEWEPNDSLKKILNNLINNPYTSSQKHTIIDNLMKSSSINSICTQQEELMITKYKNIFEGYVMPYKIVNYKVLKILDYYGIKMNDIIDYNRFTNQLLVDLHINKKDTVVTSLIKHIKETNKERYDSLAESLKILFIEDVNIVIYNDNILVAKD